jgi:Protein of unknown function (DUF1059)
MALSITCKRCRELITAETEDDLMAQVQEHARDHGGAHGRHVPPRARILAHLRRTGPAEPPRA